MRDTKCCDMEQCEFNNCWYNPNTDMYECNVNGNETFDDYDCVIKEGMKQFDLKFIGLDTELKDIEETVFAEDLDEAVKIVKSKYKVVQRIKYNGLFIS
jgi:hypothetical protein